MIETLPAQFITTRVQGKDKIPFNAATGKACDPHDPDNWLTYERACALSPTIGFVVTAQDPFCFLDFDNCLEDTGQWSTLAQQLVGAYTARGAAIEVSISGTGLHILCTADQAQLTDLRSKKDGWLERYHWGRFIQFGGTGHGGWQGNFHTDCTDIIVSQWPKKAQADADGILEDGPVEEWLGPTDDETLIQMMHQARPSAAVGFGAKAPFAALWSGDAAILGQHYPSPAPGKPWDASTAEAALAAHLAFWTGKDLARIERLIKRSRVRHTPDDRKYNRASYVMPTIRGAAKIVQNVYQSPEPIPEQQATSNTIINTLPGADEERALATGQFLTINDQFQHFANCVYVVEQHKVVMPDGELLDPPRFKVVKGGHQFQMQADNSKPTFDAFEAFTQSRCYQFPRAKRTRYTPKAPFQEIDMYGRVNAFKLPEVEATDGDVTPFLTLVEKLFPDERDRSIFMTWCAAAVQNRGTKFQWAIVLQGAEGNGKTFLLQCLRHAIGPTVTHMPNPEDMNEKYNDYLEGNLLVGVEEIHMDGRRSLLDRLKKYITNEQVEIRSMNADKRMGDNLTIWMFLTNYQDAVITHKSDRRMCIFFMPQQDEIDVKRDGLGGSFFPELYRWARDGGYAAVTGYLQRYELNEEFNPAGDCHRAPATSSRQAAIAASLGLYEQVLQEAIEEGMPGFCGGWVSMWAARELIVKRQRKHVAPRVMADALKNLGYTKCEAFAEGRAQRPIMQEGNTKPRIYALPELAKTGKFEDYLLAQGYFAPGDATNVTNFPVSSQ